ncbi:Bidirectional sugar transporter SWEET6a [Sesamum alatum]|uniref:Bidirectional sugar transporter SWEET n=1 Tax=Sesamum alatum TaxID=300844 RepID=A0AAE2CD57_9LAMI|nr:Bidirectional sugar transporter SWEET6a [Sesamum alatum]
MHGEELTRFVIGVIGNVISGLLFLSPMPTFWRIHKKRTTEAFHPYPYLASVMNCILWIFYGLPMVHPNSVLVVTINSAGLFLQLCYLTIFFCYTNKKNRGIIVLLLLAEAALFAGIVVVTLVCFHTHVKRSMFVGIVCIVFGIIMYGSPLSIVAKVVRTKSAEFMPFWLCLAGFSNGVVWFAYANLYTFDLYIAIGNGVGGLLGLVQLLVYGFYTFRTWRRGPVHNDVKPGDVQLQNVAANRPSV